jgi:hypothetical protein
MKPGLEAAGLGWGSAAGLDSAGLGWGSAAVGDDSATGSGDAAGDGLESKAGLADASSSSLRGSPAKVVRAGQRGTVVVLCILLCAAGNPATSAAAAAEQLDGGRSSTRGQQGNTPLATAFSAATAAVTAMPSSSWDAEPHLRASAAVVLTSALMLGSALGWWLQQPALACAAGVQPRTRAAATSSNESDRPDGMAARQPARGCTLIVATAERLERLTIKRGFGAHWRAAAMRGRGHFHTVKGFPTTVSVSGLGYHNGGVRVLLLSAASAVARGSSSK